MKKIVRLMYGAGVCMAGIIIFSGCGNLRETGFMQNTPSPEQSKPLTGDDLAIENYERRYATGNMEAYDYIDFGNIYAKRGCVLRQRDILERGYILKQDGTLLEELAKVFVNIQEESSGIKELAELMLQNMELEEYRAECIHMIEEDEWFKTMMPRIKEGCRNYFIARGDGLVRMVIRAGYSSDGEPYSDIWYYENGNVFVLRHSGQITQIMESGISDNAYAGEFSVYTIKSMDGDIIHETGSFGPDGAIENHSAKVHHGQERQDAYDLWNNRGNFAYSDEDGESYVVNMVKCPVFNVYEPSGEVYLGALPADAPQIRVFDGSIQYFSGNDWVTLGNVDTFEGQDPFEEYMWDKAASDDEKLLNSEFSNGDIVSGSRDGSGQGQQESAPTEEPAPTPTATPEPAARPRPTANIPAATPVPNPTAAPTEPPAVYDDDDDDDDGGDTENNNDADNGGNDAGEDNGGGDTGNDAGEDNGGDNGGNEPPEDNGGDNGGNEPPEDNGGE